MTPEELAAHLDDPVWRSGFVYTIANIETGKVYVGSSVNPKRRFSLHRRDLVAGVHHSRILQNAWNKYGESAFHFNVVEDVEDVNFMVAREQFWIWRNWSVLMNCCMVAGSPLGIKRSAEQRKAASDSKKAFYATPKGRAIIDAMHAKNRGRIQSDEERAMRSSILKGKKCGRVWTEEQRAAHSIALTGRKMPPVSAATKEKISSANKNRKRTKEAIAKSVSSRLIWIAEEIESWVAMRRQGKSFREIERITGRSRDVISRECARLYKADASE